MTPFIGVPVEFGRKAAVGLGWNDRLDADIPQCLAQPVGVESPVGEEPAAPQPFDQRRRCAKVVGLSRQQAEVDQVAERIGQGHDLGRHPATRTSDGLALSPPFAPCP